MRIFFSIIAAVFFASFSLVAAGCTAEAICEKENECASDPPGPDFIGICTTVKRGQIEAYKANDEEVCQVLAEATLAYDACRAQLDCDDYNESDLGGRCDDEGDDLRDAFEDAQSECGTTD